MAYSFARSFTFRQRRSLQQAGIDTSVAHCSRSSIPASLTAPSACCIDPTKATQAHLDMVPHAFAFRPPRPLASLPGVAHQALATPPRPIVPLL